MVQYGEKLSPRELSFSQGFPVDSQMNHAFVSSVRLKMMVMRWNYIYGALFSHGDDHRNHWYDWLITECAPRAEPFCELSNATRSTTLRGRQY